MGKSATQKTEEFLANAARNDHDANQQLVDDSTSSPSGPVVVDGTVVSSK